MSSSTSYLALITLNAMSMLSLANILFAFYFKCLCLREMQRSSLKESRWNWWE